MIADPDFYEYVRLTIIMVAALAVASFVFKI